MTSMITEAFDYWLEGEIDEEMVERLEALNREMEALNREIRVLEERQAERSAVRNAVQVLRHIEQSTFVRAIRGADSMLLHGAMDVIYKMSRMTPLDIKKQFGLSLDVGSLKARLDSALGCWFADHHLAHAWQDVKAGNLDSHKREELDSLAEDLLGFTLPDDWTGEAHVVGAAEGDGQATTTETLQAFEVCIQRRNGSACVAPRRTLAEAHELADRLVIIGADRDERYERIEHLHADQDRREPIPPLVLGGFIHPSFYPY